jgi:NAD(P)-dependent dehydrogenase (short-subunit alcohol dehydrogenase family)
MNIHGATALVTGANRGIGRHLAAQLVERGAKVYATARRPESIGLDGVEVLALDISDPVAVAAAARAAGDVNLLVNNAGIGGGTLLGDLDAVRAALDVNFWGTLSMARAFAPVLAANGGGAERLRKELVEIDVEVVRLEAAEIVCARSPRGMPTPCTTAPSTTSAPPWSKASPASGAPGSQPAITG